MIPTSIYAIHGGAAGEQIESKTETLKLPQNHDYLIFDQKSKEHFGIVYGGTSVTVVKKEKGWVYFTLQCLADVGDFIDDSTLAKDTMLFSLPPVVKEKVSENITAVVILMDSFSHVAKLFNDTKVQNAGMNTVVIKGKIYMGTGKKKALPKLEVEESYEGSSDRL